ncbi:hypothetical protein PLICRDRAFT_29719 [Plicaturopsis crispa FD-325 SS-3]|nr:hypothetical protein PLICRDRAFT_29719 [Plicaturopsis crispa FD-325 SS-3]
MNADIRSDTELHSSHGPGFLQALQEIERLRVLCEEFKVQAKTSKRELKLARQRTDARFAELEAEVLTSRAAAHELQRDANNLRNLLANIEKGRRRITCSEETNVLNHLSLGLFDNSVDQISELHIASHGRPSLDGLNYDMDNLIHNTLFSIESIQTHQQRQSEKSTRSDWSGPNKNHPVRIALTSEKLTNGHVGLLLDAFLHHTICCDLHTLFFANRVATCRRPGRTDILDDLFAQIVSSGDWTASQRWRALTASADSQIVDPAEYEGHAISLVHDLSPLISRAYRISLTTTDAVYKRLQDNLVTVYRDAHKLSLIMKRDLLSSQISVTVCSDGSLSDGLGEDVWPSMGVEVDEPILGAYNFGLDRRSKNGAVDHLRLPKVFTTALLRETIVYDDDASAATPQIPNLHARLTRSADDATLHDVKRSSYTAHDPFLAALLEKFERSDGGAEGLRALWATAFKHGYQESIRSRPKKNRRRRTTVDVQNGAKQVVPRMSLPIHPTSLPSHPAPTRISPSQPRRSASDSSDSYRNAFSSLQRRARRSRHKQRHYTTTQPPYSTTITNPAAPAHAQPSRPCRSAPSLLGHVQLPQSALRSLQRRAHYSRNPPYPRIQHNEPSNHRIIRDYAPVPHSMSSSLPASCYYEHYLSWHGWVHTGLSDKVLEATRTSPWRRGADGVGRREARRRLRTAPATRMQLFIERFCNTEKEMRGQGSILSKKRRKRLLQVTKAYSRIDEQQLTGSKDPRVQVRVRLRNARTYFDDEAA